MTAYLTEHHLTLLLACFLCFNSQGEKQQIPQVQQMTGTVAESSAPSLIFAHLAAGGGYSTTFTVVNTGITAVTGTLTITDQEGNPLTVTVTSPQEGHTSARSYFEAITTGSSFVISLLPGAIALLKADRPGAADARSGWARVDSTGGNLGGVATFQQVDGGVLKSIAGVMASPPLESATSPVDNDDAHDRYAGFAVANPNATDVHLTITTLDEDGMAADTISPTELNPLGPLKQIARFLHEYLPSRLKFRGLMVLTAQAGEKFAIVALQLHQKLLTAVPVIPEKPAWKLVWSDEFNGPDNSGVDTTKWVMETGGGGWGNRELETYTNRIENAYIANGSLVIKAMQETFTGTDGITRNYTSARLKTQGKFAQKYGRMEARIKVPQGQGMWPAFWMLGNDIDQVGWPTCGEIDIMENIGKEPSTVHGTIHGPGYSGGGGITASYNLPGVERFTSDYHIFTIEWDPEVIRWYVDGNLYQTTTPADLPSGKKWVFDHPFFILLNLAVGGTWPGNPDSSTVFPQKMLVDYVRVYKPIP